MKKVFILIFLLVLQSSIFTQTTQLPYPIIFVHGINSNNDTWTDSGIYDNLFDYFDDFGLINGGNINVTLDYDRSITTLKNSIAEDVRIFTGSVNPGDFYTINFDVHSSGSQLNSSKARTYTTLPVGNNDYEIYVLDASIFHEYDIIRIDDEFMRVLVVNQFSIVVFRGLFGSTIAAHLFDAEIWNLSAESNQAAIAKQGWGIKLAIDLVKSLNNSEKVILVGHSMGGLAAREYIRWYSQNDVAKLVTIGTPHLGSNVTEVSALLNNYLGVDERSDAIRDLRYNYTTNQDGDPIPPFGDLPDNAVFLFGGSEITPPNFPTGFYYSSDFNADGDELDPAIWGMSYDLSTLPGNIDYCWIVSELFGWLTDGDWAVRTQRQFPWQQWILNTTDPKIEVGDTIMTHTRHDNETTDYLALIRGMDEPDTKLLAYSLFPTSMSFLNYYRTIKGFITYQPNYNPQDDDVDYYKVYIPAYGELNLLLYWKNNGFLSGAETIAVYKENDELIKGLSINQLGQSPASLYCIIPSAGNYYIKITGSPTNTTWEHPYTLSVNYYSGSANVDVAQVIDRSGSMGSYGYMEPAKTAAKTFVGLMVPGDMVGVVSFSNSASINFPLTTIISDATKTAAQNAINNINSGGATSIGAGLQSGQYQLNNGNSSVHQGMVLLSDGQENTPPMVSEILPTIPENTDIYSIALGPNSDQTLLNNIAFQTGGFYSFAPDAAKLQLIYNAIRAKISGLQIIANFVGIINQSQTINHSAQVDGSVTKATFSVVWPGSDLNLELIDPNGRIITPDTAAIDPNIEFSSGSTYEYYIVNSPVSGNWTLKIIAISLPSGPEDYNASIVGSAALKMNLSFSKDEYYRSEPILITANINEVGYPMTGAEVTASVITPTLASVFSFRKSHNSQKSETLVENENSTPLHMVLEDGIENYYSDKGELFYSNSTIQLFDDGLHNDGVANDGIYASYFLNTQVEGSYIFTVNASGISPISGNFSREATISTVVGPPAVPDFTANFSVSDTCTASQNLIFGTASDATDCIDIVYDCYAPPPPPPTVLSAWFGTCSEHLLCDFRTTNVNSEIIWNVNFQPVSGCPVKFSWNPLELPSDGNFYLVDLISGEINMRNQSSHTISSPGLTSVSIKYHRPATFQLAVNITNGWNIVSIPGLNTPDQSVNTWWTYRDPGANVFRYAGGYLSITDAVPGTGYWMKHAGARAYNTGDEWPAGGIQIVAHDPITAASGWNLIGGYEMSVTAANVTTNPPGLQSGPIYKYAGGYYAATTLEPGFGYWIKLTAAGQIIIPETFAKDGKPFEYFAEDWGKITLIDAAGISYTLYAVKGEVDLSQYELPPAPPAGMFDIRYKSGRIAEDINNSVKMIDMSGVTYPLIVRVEGMDIRLMDESGKAINVNLKAGENVVISDATIQKLMVSSELLPTVYALEQNYPNPFNPSTKIKFAIANEVNVNLSVYNILGERVMELKNEMMKTGYYEVEFNASELASGIYLYRIKAGDFVETKKMVLLR